MARTFDGQTLRAARIAANIRLEQLALSTGKSLFTIRAYERNQNDPPINVLAQLADVLGQTVDAFLTDEVVDRAS